MKYVCVIVAMILATIGSVPSGRACNYAPPDPHVIDASEAGIDKTPPEAVIVTSVKVTRDPYQSGLSCWDGKAWIALRDPIDDRTPPDEIGLLLEVVDGDPPDLYPDFYPGPTHGNRYGDGEIGIELPWSEPEPDPAVLVPIRFTVRITPIDRAGNRGPSTDVVVADEVSGGCSAGGAHGGGSSLVLVASLLLGLAGARVRRRGSLPRSAE